MSALSNLWGPKYAGPVGQFKKAVEIANLPWNFPFLTGFLAAGALVLSIPVSEKEIAASKYTNRTAVMEDKKQRTGSYH